MWRQAFARPGGIWASPKIAAAVRSGERVTLYKVKADPQRGGIKTAALYTFVGISCYLIWDKIVDIPLSKLDPGQLPMAPEQEDLEPIFLPFPFTEKQVQPLPYAGAEEEWQNFIKFNKDLKLRQRVKDDLKMFVKQAAEKNITTKKWAKDGQTFKLGPTWLVVSFPERPPPEFVRTGLELGGKNGVEIKQKTLDPRTKALTDRVLMPYPIASASLAFFKAMAVQNVSTVAKYFGLSQEISTSNPDPEIQKAIKKLQARQTAGGDTSSASSSTGASESSSSGPESTEPRTAKSPAPKPSTATSQGSQNRQGIANTSHRPVGENIPYFVTLAGSGPWEAFKATYKRQWKPLRCLPPRGSLAVHGLVALESPKGRVYIDVFAWYHPKTDQFHMDSLLMNLRSITPFNQSPKR